MSRWDRGYPLAAGLLGGVLALVLDVSVPKADDQTFQDVEIEPLSGSFLVVGKGGNVRAAPRTESDRVGSVAAGDRVDVVGRAKGTEWYAVLKDGKPFGFVYRQILTRVIDAAVEDVVKGTAKTSADGECVFAITFDGRTAVEEEALITVDYWVDIRCTGKAAKSPFKAFMFMTEVPVDPAKPDEYQISVEVVEVGSGYEETLNSTMTYDVAKGAVTLRQVTPADFAEKTPVLKTAPAANAGEALKAAVAVAIGSWNAKVWQALRTTP